jgi:acid phosphatase family membrane protein YuiD
LIAGALSQVIKTIIYIVKYHQDLHWKDLFVTGGMPSTHSAAVCALAVATGIVNGVGDLLVITLILAIIVIRDAMGVRRTVGEEGKVINKIIKASKLKIPEFHYSLGHKPIEVIVGAIIGIITAIIVALI